MLDKVQKQRSEPLDLEMINEFLSQTIDALGPQGVKTLGLARDSYRFHRYTVTVPWGAIWTGRKR